MKNSRIHEYGCLMALPPENVMPHFVKFGKTAVLPSTVYTDPNDDSYGYETEPHVTLKFGFAPDLTKQNIGTILSGIKPFFINLTGISLFNNEKFDVVKFDVELNDTLREIRRRCDMFPNEDRFPSAIIKIFSVYSAFPRPPTPSGLTVDHILLPAFTR